MLELRIIETEIRILVYIDDFVIISGTEKAKRSFLCIHLRASSICSPS